MKKYAIIDNTQWIIGSYPEQTNFKKAKAHVEYLKKEMGGRPYEIIVWERWSDLLVHVIQKIIDAYKADVKLEISEDVIYLEGRLEESVVSMIIDSGEKQTVNDPKVIKVIPGKLLSAQKAIGEVKSLCSIVNRLV